MFDTWGGGSGEVGGDPQAQALLAAERCAALAFLGQCDAVVELYDTPTAQELQQISVDDPVRERQVGRHDQVLAEAAALLHLSDRSVGERLGVGWALQAHPLLRTLLQTGRLGVAHLLVTVGELLVLDDTALADEVLRDVLATGGRLGTDQTPSALRTSLRRSVLRLDPQGSARRKAEQTRDRTGLRLRSLDGGLAELVATGEASRLQLASQLLHHAARDAHAHAQDDRTRGQHQIDTLIAALLAHTGTRLPLELAVQIPVTVTQSVVRHPSCPPEPITITTDLTPALLAQFLTAAGHTPTAQAPTAHDEPVHDEPVQDEPAPEEPAFDEPDPEEPALDEPPVEESLQDLPAEAFTSDAAQALPDDPDPAVTHETPDAPLPDTGTGGLPPRRRTPHDGVPELLGHGPVDPALIDDYLDDPHGLPVGISEIRIRRICVDENGQAVAIDDTAVPLPRLIRQAHALDQADQADQADQLTRAQDPPLAADTAARPTTQTARPARPATPATRPARPVARPASGPVLPGTGTRSSRLPSLLRRLLTDLPTPPPPTDAYRPTAAQTRLVRARDHHCTFPGCRRQARRAELDHRLRYPEGPTAVSNLHPLCKHHHRLKHAGWTCTRHADGTTSWTSPRGHRYINDPP